MDRGGGPGDAEDQGGDLEDGHLVVAPDVDRTGIGTGGEREDAVDGVIGIAQRAGLLPAAGDRDGLACQRLPDEGRDGAAVTRSHSRPVAVEDTGDPGADPVCPRVRGGSRLREALCLVVGAARADGVDVSPVRLRLRMLQGITVDLGTGRENEPCLLLPGQFEGMDRASAPGLEGLDRKAQVVSRGRRGGKVKYVLHRAAGVQALGDIAVDQREQRAGREVRYVAGRSGNEVVHAGNANPACYQALAEVRAEEPGAPGDDGLLAGFWRRRFHHLLSLRIPLRLVAVIGPHSRTGPGWLDHALQRGLAPRCWRAFFRTTAYDS